MKAFILAGGFATRLWPLTEKRAKPLLPIAGKPLLTHIVENIPDDIEIVASTNSVFEQSFLDWQKTIDRPVRVIIERTKSDDEKLGALGALAQWLKDENVNEDVLLLAGDNYLGFTLSDFLARYEPGHPLLAMRDIGDKAQASKFGTAALKEDGKTMLLYEEKPPEPKSSLVSTTCCVLPVAVFPIIFECAVTHPDKNGVIWERFVERGIPAEAFAFTEPWFDVGSFDAYVDATRTIVGEQMLKGEGSSLTDSQTEGSVVLGEGSTVTKSTLKDTVLFENCVIEDCVLNRCVIDNGCVLKGVDLTGKMIREGTVLDVTR